LWKKWIDKLIENRAEAGERNSKGRTKPKMKGGSNV
jgi:hypothetical protein